LGFRAFKICRTTNPVRNSVVKVAVLGAGVTGVTTAYYLAKEGCDVTVYDRQPIAAEETSFANGGQVSISQPFPWASPDLPLKLMKWLGRKDAPLVFKLSTDPHMWSWGLRFLLSTRKKQFYRNSEKVLKLALHSKTCLDAVTDDENLQYDRQRKGILKLFENEEGYRNLEKRTHWLNELGVEQSMLNRSECEAIEPALKAATSNYIGGAHAPIDDSGDAHAFTLAMERAALNLGVKFSYGSDIQKLETTTDEITSIQVNGIVSKFDKYVISAGSYSYFLGKQINLIIPVYPVKGYSITLPIEGANNAPTVSITDEIDHVVISRLGNRLRAAGTAEINGYQRTPNKIREDMVLKSVMGLFPNAGDPDKAERWCGLRPMSCDSVPIIGKTPYRNLMINTGHGQLGWTLSCGSAQLLAAHLMSKTTELDISPYSLDRF
jgi:D-amino-acid dehydrogenase